MAFIKEVKCEIQKVSSSHLDVFRSHGDDAGVPPLGPQDVGSCEDPGLGQQGPRAEPAVLWDPGQILHTEQNLPGEQAGLGTAAAHDPLHLRGQRAGRTAAVWTERDTSTNLTDTLRSFMSC